MALYTRKNYKERRTYDTGKWYANMAVQVGYKFNKFTHDSDKYEVNTDHLTILCVDIFSFRRFCPIISCRYCYYTPFHPFVNELCTRRAMKIDSLIPQRPLLNVKVHRYFSGHIRNIRICIAIQME